MAAPTPKEIRDAYKDYRNEWQEIRDEAAVDMRFVAGDPWDSEDRAQREDAGRPCVSLDELNQYLNQYINNLRQNKIAIQVMAKGDGANDADAKKRSALIMGIEERSNAQLTYINAAQCAAERSYGFGVIRTEYRDEESFDQEILIKPILNPDTVLLSPYYKQPDASDIPDGFLLDLMPKTTFKQKYPDAEMTDFSGEVMGEQGVSDWITAKNVQVAEYWKIQQKHHKLLLIEMADGTGPQVFTEDEWKAAKDAGAEGEMKRERRVETPNVIQYMTNGLEILDEVPWAGSRIPIISCFGKELWMTEGGQAKRRLLSMIRLARDPQMLLAYLCTQECEEAGMIPKTPFVGYKGQFESDQETWEEINKVPHSFAQVDVVVDAASGQILPLPTRPAYVANFQQWELAKDSASRSIQKAMGISPLPTAAQRAGEKSGIALEKIATQEAIGSLHFSDNFKRFLHNMGWQINELITPILDTPREQAISKPDGTRATMQLVGNASHPMDDEGAYDVQGLDNEHLHTGKGEFDVTISDGPDYQSEREQQSAFVDTLLQNLKELPIPPPIAQKILALAIKMKDLGAIGDQISLMLNPPDPSNLPPEAQAAIAQLQGQLQAAQQENQALHMDRAGRVLEQQTKIQLQQMKSDNDQAIAQLQNDIKIAIAEIQTKAQSASERSQMYQEVQLENHGAAHEFALQKDQQGHDQTMAAHQAALATQQQATQIGADQQAQQEQEGAE